jgi:predicted transcriptional regulator
MRVDGDTAFRTRQVANTAARDNPNILAWASADVLLDALAPEKREFLPSLSAKSPACISSGWSLVLVDRLIVWKPELRCILRIL